jgi:hypothetical protein
MNKVVSAWLARRHSEFSEESIIVEAVVVLSATNALLISFMFRAIRIIRSEYVSHAPLYIRSGRKSSRLRRFSRLLTTTDSYPVHFFSSL